MDSLPNKNDQHLKTTKKVSVTNRTDASVFEHFRRLSEFLNDGVILVDEQGEVTSCNNSLERITGWTCQSIVGKFIWDVNYQAVPDQKKSAELYEKIKTGYTQMLTNGLPNGAVHPSEEVIQKEGGELRTVRVVSYSTQTAKGFQIAHIIQDITDNLSLERSLMQRAQELATLHSISLDVAAQRELPVLLKKIVESAIKLLKAHGGSLSLMDDQQQLVIPWVEIHHVPSATKGIKIKVGEGAIGRVAQTGKPLNIHRYGDWPGRIVTIEGQYSDEAVLSVPLESRGKVIGVLQVLTDGRVRKFSDRDQDLLILFASQAAIAIENARLLEVERAFREEAESVTRAAVSISSTLHINQVLEEILSQLERVVPYDSASVMLLEGDSLLGVAARGFPDNQLVLGTRFPSDNSLFQEILHTKAPLILENAWEDPRFRKWGNTDYVQGWMGVPLLVRDQVLGYITLDSRQRGAYNLSHAHWVESFSNQAAIAIENARLYEAERVAREEAELLSQVAEVVSGSLELNEVIRRILEQLKRVQNFYTTSVILMDPKGQPDLIAGIGYKDEEYTSQKASQLLGESPILRQMAQDLLPIIIPDVRQHSGWIWVPGAEHVRSFMCVPIISRGKMTGALMLDHEEVDFYSPSDAQKTQLLAQHLAIAIQNARSFEAERQQLSISKALQELGVLLTSTIGLDEVLLRILDLLGRVVSYDSIAIHLLQDDGTLVMAAGKGFPDIELARQITHDLSTHVMEIKWKHPQLIVIPDTYQDERWVVAPGSEYIRSWIGAPLLVKGKFIGCLNLDSKLTGAYDQTTGEMVLTFASQAALAIESARLFDVERRSRERAEAMIDAARIMASSLSLDQVLDAVLDQVARVAPFDSGNIMLLEDQRLRIKTWRGYDTFYEKPAVQEISFDIHALNSATYVFQNGVSLVITNVKSDPKWQPTHLSGHIQSWLGVPLKVRDQVIGLLNLDRISSHGFTEDEIALAQLFASHAAIAIENARLFESEGKRARELETLRLASLSLTASLNLEEVLKAILTSALSILPGANDSHIFLLSKENGEKLKFGAALWADGLRAEPYSDPRPEGLTWSVARSGTTIVVSDMRNHPLFVDQPEDWSGAIIGLPLKIGQRVSGVMNIAYKTPRSFQESELHLLNLLGDQAAIAIENAFLYQQVASEQRHLSLLYDIGRDLSSSLEIDEILNRAISLTTDVLGGLVGQAFFYNVEQNALSLRALIGRENISPDEYDMLVSVPPGKGMARWVAENKQPLYIPDVMEDKRWFFVPSIDDDVCSAISAPILSGDQLLGVLTVQHQQRSAYSLDHLELLQGICRQVSLALSNAIRYQETRRRLAEITLIQNLAQTFNQRLELEQLLDEVVNQLARLSNYPLVEIFLVEEDNLIKRAYYGDTPPGVSLPITRGVIGRVARSGKAALLKNVDLDPDYCADNPATCCELAVPIFRGSKVVGVINLESSIPDQFGPQDMELLEVLAGQISIALENAVLYEQLRQYAGNLEQVISQRTAELTEFFELSQEIGFMMSYDDLFKLLLGHLFNATKSTFMAGCIEHIESQQLCFYLFSPLSESAIQQLFTYLIKNSGYENLITPVDFEQNVAFTVLHPDSKAIHRLPALIHVPVQISNRDRGWLIISDPGKENRENQSRLLQTFANQASGAIERMETIKAAEKRRLESLIEHLPNGVLLLDAENRALVVNPLGQQILALLDCDFRDGIISRLGDYSIQELVERPQGLLPVEIRIAEQKPYFIEVQAELVDEQMHKVIMLRDVTQEKETQTRIQMQERLATVGQLAAGIAHDFNNIMAAILVYADLLRNDETLSSSSKDRLSIIQQQVQRASSLIRQILDFSRRSVMEQSPLDILPFIKELEKLLRRVLPETIHLELTYQPGSYLVNADPTRLQQVFMNLAVNARDAMQEGGLLHIDLDQYTLRSDDTPAYHYLTPGKWVRVLVRDSGAGISSENLTHIFEPFFTTKPTGVGTGLGLAQVYGIIKQHGGYIDVKSQPGSGTTFTIYLPLMEDSQAVASGDDIALSLDGVGTTVLLVEDDAATRQALQALLEAYNYRVITAANGKQALHRYQADHNKVQLVVSDVVMPEMGGLELFTTLRDQYQDIKMLFITGHPMDDKNQELLEKGVVHWLQKPFTVSEFSQAVQELLDS